jgi:hypothetical protein
LSPFKSSSQIEDHKRTNLPAFSSHKILQHVTANRCDDAVVLLARFDDGTKAAPSWLSTALPTNGPGRVVVPNSHTVILPVENLAAVARRQGPESMAACPITNATAAQRPYARLKAGGSEAQLSHDPAHSYLAPIITQHRIRSDHLHSRPSTGAARPRVAPYLWAQRFARHAARQLRRIMILHRERPNRSNT